MAAAIMPLVRPSVFARANDFTKFACAGNLKGFVSCSSLKLQRVGGGRVLLKASNRVELVLRRESSKSAERWKLSRGGTARAEIYIEEAQAEGVSSKAEVYIEDEDGGAMTIPKTQKAWIYKDYGPKETLGIAEVSVKDPAANQVLVKVQGAALNPIDTKRREGYIKASDSDMPTVPGYDAAGVVVKAGSDVTKFKVGDRVYADVSEFPLKPEQYGSLAQYVTVDEKLLAVIPERLSFAEAASLPLAVITAFQAMEAAKLTEGQTVLILGGAGGVGTLAIQLAKHVFKASLVAATASTAKVEFLKSLGADVVIDYKREDLAEHPTKYDVVFDTVGKNEGAKVVKESGAVVVISGKAEPPAFRYVLTSTGSVLEKLNPLFEDGTLKPIIDSTGPYKFDDLVEAFGYLETGRATGKVVIYPVE